jgi:tRNA (guanine37-N1)-methyltransferase
MVMKADILARALDAVPHDTRPRLLMSPRGRPLTQSRVAELARGTGAVIVCARFEGVDERLIKARGLEEVSLGDFVLSGGEIAAMALLDAVARLQPGVLHDAESHQFDSFNLALDGLLDCPHYTRPEEWAGRNVPQALLSGHHAQIERWRRDQRLAITAEQRPDLIEAARAAGRLSRQDEAFLAGTP